MKDKNTFIMCKDWGIFLKALTTQQKADLLDAIFGYQNGEDVCLDDTGLNGIFSFMKATFDKNDAEYERVCQKNCENGAKGGRPRKPTVTEENPEKPTAFSENPKNPDSDNDFDFDSDFDSDSDNGFDFEEQRDLRVTDVTPRQTESDIRDVIARWNELGVSPVSRLSSSSTRYKMLRSRLKEYGKDDVLTAIDNVRDSDFLKGGGPKGWMITFDWFVKPNNFPKVLEGQYLNRGHTPTGSRLDVVDAWV